jgi:hypothetical protein
MEKLPVDCKFYYFGAIRLQLYLKGIIHRNILINCKKKIAVW